MKKLTYTMTLLALVVGAAFAAAAVGGVAGHSAKIKSTYAGKATEKVSGQNVTALAKGTAKLGKLGKSTITGTVTGTTANPPCSPFGGPGKIKTKKGTLKVKVSNARGCAASEDERDNIAVAGTVKVKRGSAKLKKAKGSLHFSGNYNRANGTFKVKLTGTIKY